MEFAGPSRRDGLVFDKPFNPFADPPQRPRRFSFIEDARQKSIQYEKPLNTSTDARQKSIHHEKPLKSFSDARQRSIQYEQPLKSFSDARQKSIQYDQPISPFADISDRRFSLRPDARKRSVSYGGETVEVVARAPQRPGTLTQDERKKSIVDYNQNAIEEESVQGRPRILSTDARRVSVGYINVALSRLDKGATQHQMIVAYLYQQQKNREWISNAEYGEEGAFMRETWSDFITAPASLSNSFLADALIDLNAEIVITLKSKVVELSFKMSDHTDKIALRSGLRIQMLPSLRDLKLAQKHQCAAFIREEEYILVWDDNPERILRRAAELERQLMDLAWFDAKGMYPKAEEVLGSGSSMTTENMLESGGVDDRKYNYMNSVICACTLVLSLFVVGLGIKVIAKETYIDHKFARIPLILFTPVQFFLALFFMQVVIICAFQLLGPVKQYHQNTKFYSGKQPVRLKRDELLPHVTIQCPIYTESLENVVEPTIMSLKAAIATYEMQGGSANIFVNDDGMLAGMSNIDIQCRKRFYKKNNIGWVARPKHNPNPSDGSPKFFRRGRFKKASNMNFALMVSTKVEEKLALVERDDDWSQQDEDKEYKKALAEIIDEMDTNPQAGGNIRIGDYILLVDSDTRIPEDCLLDAVSEMEQGADVGILQYTSGVLHVTKDFFESGISYFTDLIYTAIGYMVANGDVAPFVGHNAFIRWKAMQDITYYDEDGFVKFWSENSVSEDFDMALRLQFEDWIIRFSTYSGEGFKEGVSLTIYDEIARWEKYAYGCSELVFHPLKDWPKKGPFTKVIRSFLQSKAQIASKLATLGYIATYYAIGSAWIFSLCNYFLIGWAEGVVDQWYLPSFDVFVGLIFIFSLVCSISLAVLRYRIDANKDLTAALIENFRWVLLFFILFGGLSMAVSRAILCHMFSLQIQWTTTRKEVEQSNFWRELPKLLKEFTFRFIYGFSCIALIVVCATALPYQWEIRQFAAIFPLAVSAGSHILLPIVLNPALMRLTW